VITVINTSTGTTPGILLTILTTTGQSFKVCRATKETPKIVCDLTVDLAEARQGEIIKYAKLGKILQFHMQEVRLISSKIVLYF
jgi:hypothetical protein